MDVVALCLQLVIFPLVGEKVTMKCEHIVEKSIVECTFEGKKECENVVYRRKV